MIIFIDGTMVLLERYYFNNEPHFMEKLGQQHNNETDHNWYLQSLH